MTWAILVGFIGYILVRAVPMVSEFYTIQRVVDRIAADAPSTVPAIRQSFDKYADIEQTISSINSKDLDISKENERVVIRFAYEKEIELVNPVFLLIKFSGRSK